MAIQLKRHNHPEAFEFDLMEVIDGGYDMLTVFGFYQGSVMTCINSLTPKFEPLAPPPATVSEAGYYNCSAAILKEQASLPKNDLVARFNEATGASDN